MYRLVLESLEKMHTKIQSEFSLIPGNSFDMKIFCLLIHVLLFFIKQILFVLQKVMKK